MGANCVDRLEPEGLVERQRETRDRRSILVRLTARGIQLVEAVLPRVLKQEKQRLERFTAAQECEQLISCLLRLFDNCAALCATNRAQSTPR